MNESGNFTRTPNLIFELMPMLGGAEFKVIMLIVRETRGWGVDECEISYSKFMKKCKLGKEAVYNALKSLTALGVITNRANGSRRIYGLNLPGIVELLTIGSITEPVDVEETDQEPPTAPMQATLPLLSDGSEIEPVDSGSVIEPDRFGNRTTTPKSGSVIEPLAVRKSNQNTPTVKKERKLTTKEKKERSSTSVDEAGKPPKEKKSRVSPEQKEMRATLKEAWIETSGAKRFRDVQVNAGIAELEVGGLKPDQMRPLYAWVRKTQTHLKPGIIYPQTLFRYMDDWELSLDQIHGAKSDEQQRQQPATNGTRNPNGYNGRAPAKEGSNYSGLFRRQPTGQPAAQVG